MKFSKATQGHPKGTVKFFLTTENSVSKILHISFSDAAFSHFSDWFHVGRCRSSIKSNTSRSKSNQSAPPVRFCQSPRKIVLINKWTRPRTLPFFLLFSNSTS